MTGTQRDAIEIMKLMNSVTVNADLVAQALGMNAGVLRKHVRDGDYHISKYEICGDRIRFFRKDFLQQIGEIEPDPPERTVEDLLMELIEVVRVQNTMLIEINAYTKKTASAATPAEQKGSDTNELHEELYHI